MIRLYIFDIELFTLSFVRYLIKFNSFDEYQKYALCSLLLKVPPQFDFFASLILN